MARWIYILVLVIGLGSSHPATKLEPVSQSNAPKVQIGASRTGQVELTLPLKITSKEELVTWATYAMRLMASKINITLADSEDKMAPEKLQKLKNSTGIITKIIDKISDDMKKKTNGTKSKSMMMAFKVSFILKIGLFRFVSLLITVTQKQKKYTLFMSARLKLS